MKFLSISAILTLSLLFTPVQAEETAVATSPLDGLLNKIGQYQSQEKNIEKAREAAFANDIATQKKLLKEANDALVQEQKRADELKREFDNNEKKLTERTEELRLRVGNLGEMFGVVRQTANDLSTVLADSLTSVEVKERKADLNKLAEAKELPTINELEDLWYSLQHEMTINGAISTFSAAVLSPAGDTVQQEVTRIGVFNAINEQGYLSFDTELKVLQALGHQPKEARMARKYLTSTDDVAAFALDPSRGALLTMSLASPDLLERVRQGAFVGYIILLIGVIGLCVAAWRLIVLGNINKRVKQQQKELTKPNDNNPLGRVLNSYYAIPKPVNIDVLEAKMDEAVLRELPALEMGQTIIKLFAGIAPLLGLLGTVTGMIATFQAITNFGTGDPKLMAGGISQALVTTVEGLIVAIPLLLAHNWVAARSKNLVQLLDEQSAGLIAEALEQQNIEQHKQDQIKQEQGQ